MFCLRTASMRAGTLLERPNDILINAAHQQIGHRTTPKLNAINDSIVLAVRQGYSHSMVPGGLPVMS